MWAVPQPRSAGALFAWVTGVIYLQLLLFDLLWAWESTFSGFQFPIGYLTKLMMATLLAAPLLVIRSRWYIVAVCLLLDIWLEANLMYFRTYYTVIPAASYGLIGNLADFTDSVWESLRLRDIILPLASVWLFVEIWPTKIKSTLRGHRRRMALWMLALFMVPAIITGMYIQAKGGFKKAYEDLMYDYSTCGAAVYTIPGAMAYEYVKGNVELTPQTQARIDSWLNARPGLAHTPPTLRYTPDNVIIILLESFESWPLHQTIEGQEITPNLNALLADSTTFYAPMVLSQVKGARSIDAQLLLHTGLMPVNYGAYSYRFVHNEYPSLDKAWKEQYGDRAGARSFTVDKRTVWNVAVVAQDFGYELYDKPYWVLDEKTGPRGRLGDASFMRQAAAKIATDEELWPTGGHTLLQLVTYSGHTPFVIPDELKKVHFSNALPERIARYLEVANYTDRAIGEFVRTLRANPKFANTMIVITGDHEGIGAPRAEYLRNPDVARFLADDGYTPLIVLNSPIAGRYDKIMGQVDIYPTLLDLLGLNAYGWRGLGQSVFDTAKQPVAAHTVKGIAGNTQGLSTDQIKHVREAFEISDLIISTNYFNENPIGSPCQK